VLEIIAICYSLACWAVLIALGIRAITRKLRLVFGAGEHRAHQ
jgi:hypothetical protein